MLFYESAACLHGRRKVLKGKYYASIFAHYQPVDRAVWDLTPDDVRRNVPAGWNEGVKGEYSSRANGQVGVVLPFNLYLCQFTCSRWTHSQTNAIYLTATGDDD